MFSKITIFMCFAVYFAVACNKYEYSYNVVECKEPQLMALGDRILERLGKVPRSNGPNTCYDENEKFLRVAPFSAGSDEFDARRLAGVWLYHAKEEPTAVFAGPEKTMEALRQGNTWNILVDKDFAVHRYILRNSTSGAISVAYLSEEELMTKMTSEQYWQKLDLIECQNFLHYLSKEFGNQLVSFTLMNKYNSNDELRWIVTSFGIGGFYKQE